MAGSNIRPLFRVMYPSLSRCLSFNGVVPSRTRKENYLMWLKTIERSSAF